MLVQIRQNSRHAHTEVKRKAVPVTTGQLLVFEESNSLSSKTKTATGRGTDITAIVIALVITIGLISVLILAIVLIKLLKKKDPVIVPAASLPIVPT